MRGRSGNTAVAKAEEVVRNYQQSQDEGVGGPAITQVVIPTTLFVGVVSFIAGAFIGPALWVSTKAGSEWLARKAKERIG
jgi:hypothetical protein